MKAESHSSSELLTALLAGGSRKGVVLGHAHLLFGGYVLALTEPGEPRMPNGIACRLKVRPGARVTIGRGRLVAGHVEVLPGLPWDPTPRFSPFECLPPGPEPLPDQLGPWFDVADPGYDALLVAYVAGLVLLHGHRRRAEQIAARSAEGALTATLARHAARGEVPERVHELLRTRDPGQLVAAGPEGMLWLRGLVSAGLPLEQGALASGGAPLALRVR